MRALRDAAVDARIIPTAAKGDASRVVERLAREGHERVLARGFLPGGTGSSFLRDFQLLRIEDAAARIARDAPRPFDAARVKSDDGDRFFINNLQSGLARPSRTWRTAGSRRLAPPPTRWPCP